MPCGRVRNEHVTHRAECPGQTRRSGRLRGKSAAGIRAADARPRDQYNEQVRHSLRRDGYVTDPETGHIMSAGPQFTAVSLAGLTDAGAIREQLDHIQRAIAGDAALAVGSAKELIESTAKVVLAERGLPASDRADCRSWCARPSMPWACTLPQLRLARTAPRRSSASSAESPPSRPGSPSCATAVTAPVTDWREHGSACRPAMLILPSTRPSPGASSCSTRSPTPKRHGARHPEADESASSAGNSGLPYATRCYASQGCIC